MIAWVDLFTAGDPHPRRFDNEDTLRAYLLKVERLDGAVVAELLSARFIEPPLTRCEFYVVPAGKKPKRSLPDEGQPELDSLG